MAQMQPEARKAVKQAAARIFGHIHTLEQKGAGPKNHPYWAQRRHPPKQPSNKQAMKNTRLRHS
eukprot:6316572-Amphidinium_carterae.1